jgi:hypothetical protein
VPRDLPPDSANAERLSRTTPERGERELEHTERLRNGRHARRPAETRHGIARNVTVALASAGVIALLVAYAFAAPTPELRLTVGHVVPQPGASAVVQGRVVEPDASGLEGMHIEVGRGGVISRRAVSDRAGKFRIDLRGGCGVYEVTLRASWQGSALERRTRRRLCPGDALPLDARIVTQGHYLWVPGPR